MVAPPGGWYWKYLSPQRRVRVLAQIVPCYVLHLTRRSYRKDLPKASLPSVADRLSSRHAAAALDVWVHQFLSAYPNVVGYRPRKESGELAICYMRFAASLNREYEYRLAAGQSLSLDRLLEDPLVAARIAEWEQFTARYTRDRVVVEFMAQDDVIADYDSYVSITTQPGFDTDPGLQIESIRLDSGGYLSRLARLVDRFNERPSVPRALDAFFHLGMAAKLADELADLATDYAEGRYNFLLALLHQCPGERADVISRLDRALPIPVSWWTAHAPRAFGEFSQTFEAYYRSLRSAELRRICDLTMLRAVRGPRTHSSTNTRHVSERPAQSWR